MNAPGTVWTQLCSSISSCVCHNQRRVRRGKNETIKVIFSRQSFHQAGAVWWGEAVGATLEVWCWWGLAPLPVGGTWHCPPLARCLLMLVALLGWACPPQGGIFIRVHHGFFWLIFSLSLNFTISDNTTRDKRVLFALRNSKNFFFWPPFFVFVLNQCYLQSWNINPELWGKRCSVCHLSISHT